MKTFDPRYLRHVLEYSKRARAKTNLWKSTLLPYIKDRVVLDWGAGPGHRAFTMLNWGAKRCLVWDPAEESKLIFDYVYGDRVPGLEWFEGSVDFDLVTVPPVDVLFIADVHGQVGPDPWSWWKSVVDNIQAQYYVGIWHLTDNPDIFRLERWNEPLRPTRTPDHFTLYSTLGWNGESGETVYKSDPRLELLIHKYKYAPSWIPWNEVPLQMMLLERKST